MNQSAKLSPVWRVFLVILGILVTFTLFLVTKWIFLMPGIAGFWVFWCCAVLASGLVGGRWILTVPMLVGYVVVLFVASLFSPFSPMRGLLVFLFAVLAFGFIWSDWLAAQIRIRRAAPQENDAALEFLQVLQWVAKPGSVILGTLFPISSDFDASTEPNLPYRANAVRSAFSAAGVLYLLTLLIEGIGALARSVVYFFVSLVVLLPLYFLIFSVRLGNYYGPLVNAFGVQTNQFGYDYTTWLVETGLLCLQISLSLGLILGFWPLLTSLFHILFPVTRSGAGPIEVESLGAREPTREELARILDALAQIRSAAGSRRSAAPSRWLVIDEASPDAYTIGSTVYLSRAAVESPHLSGIMAHEMGHIAHKDGDLILALRRFIVPLAYYIGIDRHPMPAGAVLKTGAGLQSRVIRTEDEKIYYRFKALQIKLWLAFWCGGLGMFLLGRQWAAFWRERDHLADRYAVALGQEELLMDALTLYRHVDVAQPFLLTNRPYTAERLDRLQG